jgi:sugar phosphate isomerase/epimerase
VQAEKAGVEIVALHWLLAKTEGFHLTAPDAGVRRKTAEYLGELARFCGDLGGRVLVFGSPDQRNLLPGVSRADATRYAADVLRSVVPALEDAGVVFALEPLGPEWTDFLRNAAEAVELARMVDSPLVRLHLDCKAMSSETVPIVDLIVRHRDRLVHFHANDPNGQGPGSGELDFVPILKTLEEIGYEGWVSVEVFDYEPGSERLARESIRYMQECLASGE